MLWSRISIAVLLVMSAELVYRQRNAPAARTPGDPEPAIRLDQDVRS